MKIRVMLADDHNVVREGIRAIIKRMAEDVDVYAEAADGQEVLKLAKNNPADIYILDISMPHLNGIEVADRLIRRNKDSKVIILSMYDDKASVEKAFKCGVMGYVTKESASEELVTAIREVFAGRQFVGSKKTTSSRAGYAGKKLSGIDRKLQEALTRKEMEVLQLIVEGLSGKEIADELDISYNTAHVHRNNIMRKLNIHKQTELIHYAVKEKLIRL